jgi:DNA-binding transcriptional MerR regulator
MVASTLPDGMLTINQVAEATGLTPSLLRIWESRYGWPTPRRLANGYRTYHPRQLDDIRRVADLVRAGRNIGSIIIDGLPKWPEDPARAPRRPRLQLARSLPPAPGGEPARLRDQLVDAIEHDRLGEAEAILQRLIWLVRPADEAVTCHLPVLAACAECQLHGRLPTGADALLAAVEARTRQLLRTVRPAGAALRVAPLGGSALDRAAAAVLAWLLARHGAGVDLVPAPPRAPADAGGVAGWWLAASDASPHHGPDATIHVLPSEGRRVLSDLLAGPAPWARPPR